jgi:diadenosine tetraphosphate (Ap4A) HIT family hydrolase
MEIIKMEFMQKFKPNELCLKDFKYWVIVLRQKQLTLGDAVILLKREVASIGDATKDEFAEFPLVIKWYEKKCKALFSPDKFNYVAAMMKDNFVHFHAFPRYEEIRQFADLVWKDEQWSKPIALLDCSTDPAVLSQLLLTLKD